MSAHLSNELVDRFHAQALVSGDRGVIYDHILQCESCRLRVVNTTTASVAMDTIVKHLMPQDGDEPFHLSYETIEGFVRDELDAIDRQTAKLHLEDCAECLAEVDDLRESLATMKAASRKDEIVRADVALHRPFRLAVPMRIAAMIALVAFAAVALLVVRRWKSSAPTRVPGTDTTAGSQPTPLASPAFPSLAPSPSTVSPPSLAGNHPPSASVALRDGPNEISIDHVGNVGGLPSLPADSREAVKNALSGESLTRPEVLDEVATAEGSVRGPSENEDRIRIVSPTGRVISQDKPRLQWKSLDKAGAYRIEIADENFRQVAKSDDLPAPSTTWAPAAALKRGQVYTWTIRAVNKEGELSPLVSQGKFKILGEDRLRELNQLKARRSHLAVGLFYAREGMIADAEREFEVLVKDNPSSAVAKKLLKEVRAWKKH